MAIMTEDEVRDNAKKSLGFDKAEAGAQQGTGQLTTFNQLGITGEGKDRKPDGWYLPEDKGAVAIILETKNSGENLGKKAHIDELLRNCRIVLDAGWKNVVGLLHNGKETKGYINNIDIDVPDVLQGKSFYIKLVTDKAINKGMIYTLTARINNCLHTEFGVKNLYHRMIFTACALVAERYGARLSKVKDMGYEVFHTAIRKQLEAALEEDKQQNGKIEILLDVYSDIKMNVKEKQKAINDFIDWVIAVSDCINSNHWHGEDVMGIFFNEFNRYKKKSDAGQVFTPDHITSFMYRLLNISKYDYVGDFACGSGAFLVKAMSNMIEEVGGIGTKAAKEIREAHLFG
ncbi:MAG: SAM-dependent DNA methyltransferase, partial [Schwartzia sp.]|nr:SAM-dependent DNA methyltransferase [Schwartzia sp. (in: firmicutes)]